ncbi:MAG: hypothetical protein WA705_16600 [Candidatus Ozemobacteraceae bacterium]
MNFFLRFRNLDRRIIYIFIAAAVVIPMFKPIGFKMVPGEYVRGLYSFVDALPKGTRVFLSFDYDPAAQPELHPAAIALLVHLFKKELRPVCGANWVMGGELADSAITAAVEKIHGQGGESAKREIISGRDYANLGYKPGGIIQVKRIVADFLGPFPVDCKGVSTANMEIFRNSDARRFAFSDFGLVVSFMSGNKGIEDYIYVSGDHKRPMATACSSVTIPHVYTYMQTGQLIGMIGGMPGAAEYETLIGMPGTATAGMDSQSMCHLVIIGFILLGNLVFLAERRIGGRQA